METGREEAKRLKHFVLGQRVRVMPAADLHPDLIGRLGTIRRVRRTDSGAWVRMDEPLPSEVRAFPEADERERDLLLFPYECKSAPPASAPEVEHG